MVVIVARDHIGADACVAQDPCKGGRQPDRRQRRMHCQANARPIGIGWVADGCQLLNLRDQRQTLVFAYYGERRAARRHLPPFRQADIAVAIGAQHRLPAGRPQRPPARLGHPGQLHAPGQQPMVGGVDDGGIRVIELHQCAGWIAEQEAVEASAQQTDAIRAGLIGLHHADGLPRTIDYLLKPIEFDEMVRAIEKFKSLRSERVPDYKMLIDLIQQPKNRLYRERFMVSIGTKIHSLEVANTAFFYSEEKSSFLVTKNGLPYPMDYSLDQLGAMLDPTLFFRINRQYLVSRQGIKAIYTYSATKIKVELEPDSRQEVFVSVNRIPEFKDWLGR